MGSTASGLAAGVAGAAAANKSFVCHAFSRSTSCERSVSKCHPVCQSEEQASDLTLRRRPQLRTKDGAQACSSKTVSMSSHLQNQSMPLQWAILDCLMFMVAIITPGSDSGSGTMHTWRHVDGLGRGTGQRHSVKSRSCSKTTAETQPPTIPVVNLKCFAWVALGATVTRSC